MKERTGHSTTAVTEGTAEGKMVGLVTSRDYRISRMSLDERICDFMTPFDKLVYAEEGVTLSEANDILWDNKMNALPIEERIRGWHTLSSAKTTIHIRRILMNCSTNIRDMWWVQA